MLLLLLQQLTNILPLPVLVEDISIHPESLNCLQDQEFEASILLVCEA